MEKQITETVKMSFGVIAKCSNDERAIKALAVLPENWNDMCGDNEDPDQIRGGTFEGVTAAVFRHVEGDHAFGYILFVPRQDDLVEQHTVFCEAQRGNVASQCIRAAHKELFLTTKWIGVLTFCPEWNPGARHLAQKVGAVKVSTVPNFRLRGGRWQGAALYHLLLWTWSCDHHDEFQDTGEAWHDRVFSQLPEAKHEDDPAHNGWLGLAVEMGKRQPHKAVEVYNSWAIKAGYALGKLLWADGNGHSLIDFGHGIALNGPESVLAVLPKCPPSPQSEQSCQQAQP